MKKPKFKNPPKTLTVTIRLNGTDTNSWHKFSLRCNPFPQFAQYELDRGMHAINELDGDPLNGPTDIQQRLQGRVSQELIDLCIRQFKPGERVEFDVEFPNTTGYVP
jgi:hypothetical protein